MSQSNSTYEKKLSQLVYGMNPISSFIELYEGEFGERPSANLLDDYQEKVLARQKEDIGEEYDLSYSY